MVSFEHKSVIFLLIIGMLLSSCSPNLWGTNASNLTPSPTSSTTPTGFSTSTSTNLPPLVTTQATTLPPEPTITPTATITVGTPRPSLVYFSQSGDSLEAVALHFGVQTTEITSSVSLPGSGLLDPNTLLLIPNLLSQTATTPSTQIIPDSELVYSPSAVGFDINSYIDSAGGTLRSLRVPMVNGMVSAAQGIQQIANESSISPRMLLALIQYHTGWVQGEPMPGIDPTYPLGYHDAQYSGLFLQMHLMLRELLAGYYGWRDGSLLSLTFPDGSTLRLAPDLNAGSVAMQYLFSKHLNQPDWLQAIDPDTGFPALFTKMYGDPWERAQETGPLFPPDLTQPILSLPFEVGVLWNLTSGPHAAWEQESARGALDFAPAGVENCSESTAWVVAVASGQIVRSEIGYVVLDVDPDGLEQTGWVVLYQHISSKDRIPVGRQVKAGDHIGHPSCEGGTATGTHIHIARKYNGEWMAAGDPLPFVMSGWTAHAGSALRQGSLTKGDRTITASPVGSYESQIIRRAGE
jgi:LasA protease